MPWNGRSRLFNTTLPQPEPSGRSRWQALRWAPVGLAILMLAAMAVPAASSAATPSRLAARHQLVGGEGPGVEQPDRLLRHLARGPPIPTIWGAWRRPPRMRARGRRSRSRGRRSPGWVRPGRRAARRRCTSTARWLRRSTRGPTRSTPSASCSGRPGVRSGSTGSRSSRRARLAIRWSPSTRSSFAGNRPDRAPAAPVAPG